MLRNSVDRMLNRNTFCSGTEVALVQRTQNLSVLESVYIKTQNPVLCT